MSDEVVSLGADRGVWVHDAFLDTAVDVQLVHVLVVGLADAAKLADNRQDLREKGVVVGLHQVEPLDQLEASSLIKLLTNFLLNFWAVDEFGYQREDQDLSKACATILSVLRSGTMFTSELAMLESLTLLSFSVRSASELKSCGKDCLRSG